jgi:toluene monooxygenase electron transfer component
MTGQPGAWSAGHRIRIAGSEQEYCQLPDDTVLRAALRAGIGFPYECNSGGCGSCTFQVLEGEVDDLWDDAPGRSARDRRTGRRLACQSRATTDLHIAVRTSAEYVPPVVPAQRTAVLRSSARVTHDIRSFRFVSDDAAEFLPGQYAVLQLPGVPTPRCYSMSNLPNATGEWEFMVRRVPGGEATTALFDRVLVGDEIVLDGPYGLAWLRTDSPRDLVCVAGGSGLAPMVSVVRGAAAAGMLQQRRVHFFYGARTPRDVCGEQFIHEQPGSTDHVHFHPVVSLPELEPEAAWTGATGFVHDALGPTLGADLATFEWYFAGPPPMTQALQERLVVEHGVPHDQVHFDRFC